MASCNIQSIITLKVSLTLSRDVVTCFVYETAFKPASIEDSINGNVASYKRR